MYLYIYRGCNNFLAIAESTSYYNVIDHPAGVIPVCRVDSKKDQISEEWRKEPDHGSKILETGLFGGKKPLYNPEQMHDMPVAIQVVGQRWEDEKVLAMMKVVDSALGSDRVFGPGAWSKMSSNATA
jgi:amidase